MEPIIEVKSHVKGKNADLRVYPDRVEWSVARKSAVKVIGAIASMGASALVTGVNGSKTRGSEMILMRSISSITTKRDSMLNSIVTIIAPGNTVDIRVSHAEAEQIKQIVLAHLG